MKKTLATVVLMLLAALGSRAQDAAGVAMPFSVVPRNVRTLSMGGLVTADAAAPRLLGSEDLDISASWYSWSPKGASSNDINLDAFARLSRRLALSARIGLDFGPRYDIYDAQGVKGGFSSTSDILIGAGAAFLATPDLSIGVDLRFMSSSPAAKKSYGAFGADIMAAYSLAGARLAAGITSLGSSVKASDGASYSLPTAVTLAGKYGLSFAEKHSLEAGAQLDVFFKGGLRAGIGAEYGFNDLAFLRLGYSYGGKSPFPGYFSAGVGVKFSGFHVDATYLLGSSAVGGTLGVGLGYSF